LVASRNGNENKLVGKKWKWEISLVMGMGWDRNGNEVMEMGVNENHKVIPATSKVNCDVKSTQNWHNSCSATLN